MINTYVMIIIAGLFAGAWPLAMQRSGLSSVTVILTFGLFSLVGAMVLLLIIPNARVSSPQPVSWNWVIIGGILAASPSIIVATILTRTTPKELSLLYLLLLLVQISTPAVIYAIINQGLTLRQAFGFAAALLAGILLTTK